MAKILIKQGFLGMGRPIEKWFCDKCGVGCDNRYYKPPNMYCLPCANDVDPDIVHMWPSEEIVRRFKANDFFCDSADGQRKLIESCNRCLSLLVTTNSGDAFVRKYYKLGSESPLETNFKCVEHPGYDKDGNVGIQTSCEHSFQVVGTTKRIDAEAHAKFKHMLSHRNFTIEAMYGVAEIDLQYHCFGSTHYWCSNCGRVRSLNPQREHLLPKNGMFFG